MNPASSATTATAGAGQAALAGCLSGVEKGHHLICLFISECGCGTRNPTPSTAAPIVPQGLRHHEAHVPVQEQQHQRDDANLAVCHTGKLSPNLLPGRRR